MKPDDVVIPDDALSEKFLAATGPGGQNVNKVATACQLRVDVYRLGLEPHVFHRLKTIAGMGHDLPLALVDEIADAITGHAQAAAPQQAQTLQQASTQM